MALEEKTRKGVLSLNKTVKMLLCKTAGLEPGSVHATFDSPLNEIGGLRLWDIIRR